MKSFALAALWVVASIGAVSVAWAGVSVVNSEVIDPAPATVAPVSEDVGSTDTPTIDDSGLNQDDLAVESSMTSPQSSTTTIAPSPTTTSSPESSGSTGGTSPTTTTIAPGSTTSTGPPESTSTTVPTSSTTVPTSSTTVPTSSTTVPTCSTTVPPVEAETITFTLTGGTTAISFSASGVTVLWATPNPGFDVKIEPESPGWKVEFRSDTHRSRIDAWWNGGPVFDIEERDN